MIDNCKREESIELLRELSLLFGPSGYENEVRDVIKKKAEDKALRDQMMSRARDEVMRRMRESEELFEGISIKEYSLDED